MMRIAINRMTVFSAVLLLLTGVMLSGCRGNESMSSSQGTEAVEKSITVTMAQQDGTREEYPIRTTCVYLADALYENDFLSEEEYRSGTGSYTEILEQTANYERDAAWWCLMRNGEICTTGWNELEIADGDAYDLVYTIG